MVTIVVGLAAMLSAQPVPVPLDSAFGRLRAAYEVRDAAAAAAAYSPEAEVRYAYSGQPVERYRGRAAITASFQRFFAGLPHGRRIDLNFRIISRRAGTAVGVYRLRVGADAFYGRFDVGRGPDGFFGRDISTSATREDFERAAGPLLFGNDAEDLDATFYNRMLGRYRTPTGCELIVTRSVVRLFVRNSCTQQWHGLTRVSGERWVASRHTIGADTIAHAVFTGAHAGGYRELQWVTRGRAMRAHRRTPYRTEGVTFTAADGTRLAGTLYLPHGGGGPRPAAVMIHGSGAQDRHGYASIIGVLADALAAEGRVALAFDKRGVGDSAGDWRTASFSVLADDVAAAAAYLSTRIEVDAKRIGFAGSSQAGWVAATAIARGARPADVFMLGAAGAAMTVAEQNLYNTRIRMECSGIPRASIALALAQQSAFFAFLRDSARGAELDSLTLAGARTPALRDWLFPDSREVNRSAGEWYVTLDPAFDPRPVWRKYRGATHFVFGEHDDATDTEAAVPRVQTDGATAVLLAGVQHLGLRASDRCHAGLSEASHFAPELFREVQRFAGRPYRVRREAIRGINRSDPPG